MSSLNEPAEPTCFDCFSRSSRHKVNCPRRPQPRPVRAGVRVLLRPSAWVATLPAALFPFMVEYLSADRSATLWRMIVLEQRGSLLMPRFPDWDGPIRTRIEWADGTIDEFLDEMPSEAR